MRRSGAMQKKTHHVQKWSRNRTSGSNMTVSGLSSLLPGGCRYWRTSSINRWDFKLSVKFSCLKQELNLQLPHRSLQSVLSASLWGLEPHNYFWKIHPWKTFLQKFCCLELESNMSLSHDGQAGNWTADLVIASDLQWDLNQVLLHEKLQIATIKYPVCTKSRQKYTSIFLKKHIGFSINSLFPRARIEPKSPAPPPTVYIAHWAEHSSSLKTAEINLSYVEKAQYLAIS